MEEKKDVSQEEPKEDTSEAVIKAVRDEYEAKIKELNEQHIKELEEVRKQEEEKAIRQIKALISGREVETEPAKQVEELTWEEEVLKETREHFNLKGE